MRKKRSLQRKRKSLHRKNLPGKKFARSERTVSDKRSHRQNVGQLIKFGIVGGMTTASHAGLFIFIMETRIAGALQANFIAFSVAFLVSFLGQYHWTFRNSSDTHWAKKMAKFMIVALLGLGLNTAAVFIIVDKLVLPYMYAVLVMITVVPIVTFLVNKKWAFS